MVLPVDEHALESLIAALVGPAGVRVFLTGAGVSAESGVPTFRGAEGYWVVGSRNYHAQELATNQAFRHMPAAVWGWYLHRLRVCRAAAPNAAHHAIASLAHALGDGFQLITQNVDGLHARAGTPAERTYEIHGNISRMRCSHACEGLVNVPDDVLDEGVAADEVALATRLRCGCGAWMRPHVLWFDEFYDEPLFRFESSLAVLERAALLVVIGTTGATNLPRLIGERAAQRGVPIVVINPERNPFADLVNAPDTGVFLAGGAGQWVPRLVELLRPPLG